MGIDLTTYVALSAVMFLEFAIWGAWAPVLAARLLGPLNMSGKQAGQIYATLPVACIFAPFLAGFVADRWVNAEWVLIGAHLIGAVLLFVAARTERFTPLLVVMFCYSVCYATTLPLVNTVLFAGTADIQDAAIQGATQAKVFIWAPIAWALAGWSLSGWRMTRKTTGDGSDCLYLAGALSTVMVLASVLVAVLSPTPPSGGQALPVQGLLKMLAQPNFLVFVLVSLVVFGLMQFYFLGSAPFLQDKGIASKHVPGLMALAQIAQALATWFLFILMIEKLGYKWTLAIGALSWALLYAAYTVGRPRALLAVVQPLHGLAYVLFVIVGQKLANDVSPEEIRSSMQALMFAATTGVGLFLGTQFAGVVMDMATKEGKVRWPKVWIIPAAITLAGVLVLVLLFREPRPKRPLPATDVTAGTGRMIAPCSLLVSVVSMVNRGSTAARIALPRPRHPGGVTSVTSGCQPLSGSVSAGSCKRRQHWSADLSGQLPSQNPASQPIVAPCIAPCAVVPEPRRVGMARFSYSGCAAGSCSVRKALTTGSSHVPVAPGMSLVTVSATVVWTLSSSL